MFNPRPLWLHCGAAALLSISVAFFAVLFPTAFGVWARRTLALSERALAAEHAAGGRRVSPAACGRSPAAPTWRSWPGPTPRCRRCREVVEVRYRTEGGGRGRATMDRRGVARGPEDHFQEYAYTFRSILADIHFDVVGGDDRVRDLWIQAVDSPTISQMTLDCELPAYIGRKQPPLPVTGVMQIPMGSRVTVRAGQANKDLVARAGRQHRRRSARRRPRCSSERELAADRRGFSYALGAADERHDAAVYA